MTHEKPRRAKTTWTIRKGLIVGRGELPTTPPPSIREALEKLKQTQPQNEEPPPAES